MKEFLFYLVLPAALGPGIYSASNRNEYQPKAVNLTDICEPSVYKMWEHFSIVFIVCNVPFIVCVALCTGFCLSFVCYFV
jgi:hypothetical protein